MSQFPRKLLLKYLSKKTHPIDPGLYLLNLIIQKLFRINCHIPWMVHFTSRVTGDVEIGKNVWLSFAVDGGCYIQGLNKIFIGDDTIFGPGVKIISANHNQKTFSKMICAEPIRIGKKCWIGANAIILPSVELGDNVIVAARSVVNKSFPDNIVIGGNPESVIRANKES